MADLKQAKVCRHSKQARRLSTRVLKTDRRSIYHRTASWYAAVLFL